MMKHFKLMYSGSAECLRLFELYRLIHLFVIRPYQIDVKNVKKKYKTELVNV